MHVVHINFYTSAACNLPEDILRGTPSLVDLALAACAAGSRVSVIQSCGHRARIARGDVVFHFLQPRAGECTVSTNPEFAGLIRELGADVFHVHGLGFNDDVLELARIAPGVPILLQDHASHPPRPWHRRAWRRAAGQVAGYAFCALAQAEPFKRARLLRGDARLYEIPEASSRFQVGERESARRDLGLHGNPALLWVAHLNDNKDPLTVLAGVAEAVRALPRLTLWCCYATAPLLERVQHRVANDANLRDRVHLLGRQPAATIEKLMHAADFYVSGSHREGSGFALIEALACGLPPIVTDIPSFRALCGTPTREFLWRPGDARGLARALNAAAAQRGPALRGQVRAHFEREISYPAIGQRFTVAYRELAEAARS